MLVDDWRLRGQEDYLQNRTFKITKFKAQKGKSLHTHCEFCWHKFMENCEGVDDCSQEGYCTNDDMYWVCKECFEDFKKKFHWNCR